MNISLVTETYKPEVNGVSNTLGYWVDGMIERDIYVQIVRPKQNPDDTGDISNTESHITVRGLPIPGYKELNFGLPCTRKLKKIWKKSRPDAIYVATEGPLGWSAVRAARSLGIPVLSGFHTNFQSYSRFYKLGWLEPVIYSYLRYFHNLTKGTLVPTKKQQQELERHGFKNVSVLSRGVDCDRFSPNHRSNELRSSWRADSTDQVLLYVGRLAGEKNLAAINRVYEEAQAKQQTVKMVFVGDGPMRAKLEERCPNAVFAGTKTGRALSEHYASADIFLFPSKTDTFGNVVTEAMASGLAVVSYDDAAAHEHLTHKESGLLSELTNDKSYIQNALSLANDESLVTHLRTNARTLALGISWDAIVEELISHLLGTKAITMGVKRYDDSKNASVVR